MKNTKIPFKRSWIPNSVTALSAFLGYLSIMYTLQNQFVLAAWLIIMAGVLDMLDGKLARIFGGESKFGSYFDSLADSMNYGVAISLLFYQAVFVRWEFWGGVISFLPTVCAAIRLARFNVLTDEEPKGDFFAGLPTTAAAGFLASFVIFMQDAELTKNLPVLAAGLIVMASFLMVSEIPYAHNSTLLRKNRKTILLFILSVITILSAGGRALFFWVALYVVYGLVRSIVYTLRDHHVGLIL